MTPKEKALELVEKMKNIPSEKTEKNKIHFLVMKQTAIRQALIAVDDTLNELFEIAIVTCSSYVHKHIDYYQEVKQEIEKL